ncbi:hypothetical protein ONZ43_g6398 [Nemania bipapillata]|uniref:Uncharacterized protein n=1 Tax=Nemania bipapillata TaxID=110536 RepID=A0ACC2I0M3_9PEZI|nr:hypothetical protein ONZ43_g6398 [Nemania bipapillata]
MLTLFLLTTPQAVLGCIKKRQALPHLNLTLCPDSCGDARHVNLPETAHGRKKALLLHRAPHHGTDLRGLQLSVLFAMTVARWRVLDVLDVLV